MKNKNNIICMATMIVVMSLSFAGCGKVEITTENETEMSTEAVTETEAEVATETETAVETTEELTSESTEADEKNDKPQISYIAIEEKAKAEERIRKEEEKAEVERQAAEVEKTTESAETQTAQAKTTEAQTTQAPVTETPVSATETPATTQATTESSSSNNTETHGDGYNIPGPVSNILSSGRGYYKHWLCDENGNMIESTVWYDDIYGYAYDINGNYEGWNIYDY